MGEAGVHLTALVDSPEHVCCRYRLEAFRPMWEKAGHSLHLQAIPHSVWNRLKLFHQIQSSDAVILQRKLLPGHQLRLLRKRVGRLLFDFDDAVWMRDSFSDKGFHSTRREGRFARTIRACDAVIAGNAFLADAAEQIHRKANISIVPTCVDVGRYEVKKSPTDDENVELVWIGSASTLQGLERARAILEVIGSSIPGCCLKMICDKSIHLEHVPVNFTPWNETTEAREIARGDIGISWIPDDPWSRGKCGLKVLQYMAAGLPVVANPVGVHPTLIENGVHGFLPTSLEEWVDAVRTLKADPDLRMRMGAAARKRVEECYSTEVGAQLWLRVLHKLARQAA